MTFGVPLVYFAVRGQLRGKRLLQAVGLLGLGGAQGAVGWWMVRSGLEEDLDHPRVNHYRLATHFGSALVIYSSLMWMGMNETAASRPPVARIAALPRSLAAAAVALTGAVYVTGQSSSVVPPLPLRLTHLPSRRCSQPCPARWWLDATLA